MEKEENTTEINKIKHHYCVLKLHSEQPKVIKTNLQDNKDGELLEVFRQRLEKGQLHKDVGTVIPLDLGKDRGCYYYTCQKSGENEDCKYVICFVLESESVLDLFRADLDEYCAGIVPQVVTLPDGDKLSESLESSLENWFTNTVEYIIRCKQAVRDSLKFLIHAALLDKKLVLSGGTAELQNDIQRFYTACSLSDILAQLRDSRGKSEDSSLSGSLDMLIDLDSGQTDTQSTLTVSITEDSVKLDSSGCNKFCEEWANSMSKPEYQDNPVKMKQVIEAFKLKFIQTMNNLKRLLREAENNYYALYRSYVFLRDSGNSEVLMHYVIAEGVTDTANVLRVLQDFIQEQLVM